AASPGLANVAAGHRPRALALTPDGSALLCANMTGGSLSRIDVGARKETDCLPLPALNLRGVAVAPDGRRAFVTGQRPNAQFTTPRPEATWNNHLLAVRLDSSRATLEADLPLDTPDRGAADPSALAFAGPSGPLCVTLSGTHELALLPNAGFQGSTSNAQRLPVGANPRAAAARPGTGEVWVANHLGNSLSVVTREGRHV